MVVLVWCSALERERERASDQYRRAYEFVCEETGTNGMSFSGGGTLGITVAIVVVVVRVIIVYTS